jgi:hypothetical protein
VDLDAQIDYTSFAIIDLELLLEKQPPDTIVNLYPREAVTLNPFTFLPNVSSITGEDAMQVVPGCTLRRATSEKVKFTKELIRSLFGEHFGVGLWETRRPTSGSGEYRVLPARQWRYFVIEGAVGIENVELLETALAIAPIGLEVGFSLSRARIERHSVPVCSYRPPRLFQSLSALSEAHDSPYGSGKAVTNVDLVQVRDIYERLKTHDHSVLDLHRTLALFLELKDLPHFSPLQILGCFAILESILTHQPKPEDRYDSITRQITKKLALLNKRWNPSLDYTSFGTLTHDKLWSKMYAYRSAIAHGAKLDFGSELSALRTANNANLLISATVRKAICHVLVEPQLLADLHNC